MSTSDIPNCPVHSEPMRAATHWITVAEKPFPVPCFVCGIDGCLQVFGQIRGHRVEPEGAVIGNPLSSAAVRLRYFGR